MVVYIPPQGAVHYRDNDSNCHVAALDSCLVDITERLPEAHIVCCGDFNARTVNIQMNNIILRTYQQAHATRCLYFSTADLLVTAQLMILVNVC